MCEALSPILYPPQTPLFMGFSQARETEPFSPEALARGYKLLNLQPYNFVAADSLICSLVAYS